MESVSVLLLPVDGSTVTTGAVITELFHIFNMPELKAEYMWNNRHDFLQRRHNIESNICVIA